MYELMKETILSGGGVSFLSFASFDTKEEAKVAESDYLEKFGEASCYFDIEGNRHTLLKDRTIVTKISRVIDFG